MVCAVCERLSWQIVCQTCAKSLLTPEIARRKVGTLEVISFFPYETIELLLTTKHTPKGWRVFGWLGKRFLRPFLAEYGAQLQEKVAIAPIDDRVKSGYSHTAVLAHTAQSRSVRAYYGVLRSQNNVSYSGKSLAYRIANPRNFKVGRCQAKELVLIDDIVTTGTTLQEAYVTLMRAGVSVSFAIVLADASR